jgi:fructokinase
VNPTLPIVVGIGEVLWDMLPTGPEIGGAPANFAWHAQMLGAQGFVVSAVGADSSGQELRTRLAQCGVHTEYLSVVNGQPTGAVRVEVSASGRPSFHIQSSCAWDFIPWSPALGQLAAKADAVSFGCVAQRTDVSRETITSFLKAMRPEALRILDINLRPPYYNKETVLTSLRLANVLKLNEQELLVLQEMVGLSGTEESILRKLLREFKLRCVAVTRGPEGSMMASLEQKVECPGMKVKVVDAVGAGDAFTAGMALGLLWGLPLSVTNELCCRIAAFVCSKSGATPRLPREMRPIPAMAE